MNFSKSASSFAPYAPPPDDPKHSQASSSKFSSKRPWFPTRPSSAYETSYQSGGIPTFNNDQTVDPEAIEQAEGQVNQWETRFGARVDMLAAWAYILGPVTALAILILETKNDYIRFHAYQAALLSTPLVVIRFFASLIGFWSWLRTTLTLIMFIPCCYMSYQAHWDANHNNLERRQLPYIGQIADRWVAEE